VDANVIGQEDAFGDLGDDAFVPFALPNFEFGESKEERKFAATVSSSPPALLYQLSNDRVQRDSTVDDTEGW
jgi:hypothetical protein